MPDDSKRCPFSMTSEDACPGGGGSGGGDEFRNLFGPAAEKDLFKGYGPDTGSTLLRLAASMAGSEPSVSPPDSSVPAGFTYLAQFAAHDLVQTATSLPQHRDPTRSRTDLRKRRLMLDTIYGGGPTDIQCAYAHPSIDGGPRTRLRLLDVAKFETESPNSPPPRPQLRDLPRATITETNDRFDGELPNLDPRNFLPDVLIADLRNDDNLIIAQLTVIFHLLHNAFDEYLDDDHSLPGNENAGRRFVVARKLTTRLYRRVLLGEMLRKLLDDGVYTHYKKDGGRLEQTDNRRMALEFSHGAFRAGHAMVRENYRLNENTRQVEKPINQILERTSARNPGPRSVPHLGEWLISWSSFFQIDGKPPPQMSRALTPSVAQALFTERSFSLSDGDEGRLLYRDLLRGALAGLRSVHSLTEIITKELPSRVTKNADFLRESHYSVRVRKWLEQNRDGLEGNKLTSEDIQKIVADTPLLFLVLLEAEETQKGQCLGVLGSTIIAEIFFSAYDEGFEEIEKDKEISKYEKKIFGNKPLKTISDIVWFVAEKSKFDNVEPSFL